MLFPQKITVRLVTFLLVLMLHLNLNAQVEISNFHSGKLNGTLAELSFGENRTLYVDFYGENIFRLFYAPNAAKPHDPVANPPARILCDNPRRPVSDISFDDGGHEFTFRLKGLILHIDKRSGIMDVGNPATGAEAFRLKSAITIHDNKVTAELTSAANEYFFGGGVQNGRFSHKGKSISIENQNSWTDGGVASPAPFYWSTKGYGILWHSFKPGRYDFGTKDPDVVKLFHNDSYLDVFVMIDEGATSLLQDYYQLTGAPVLLPKFAFFEGHLNAYNRDYWKQDTSGKRGILFEDGKRYTESQKDNGGIRESLNGELNNYQFSARAVIDRYRQHDMPLGWILPNDGYGAGYGQTGTLDSNVLNLKIFGDYARKNGVETGLWTQSDLHPKPGVSALLQRDIIREVRDAGVRVLKTDVAWVGAGYSFGLNGVADAAGIIPKYGNNARPFIITLDGWAGTQRYAAVWSGDQTGGNWEYIRFHIPTYIGSGLSGQPNITSDMDGIFGGRNVAVNVRDFQWKTFTPMQLNMDGWGTNEKYPHALGEPAASINRLYLKLKSELLPYSYSIAREASNGMPLMRAMFLEESNAFTLGTATQYQYMYGPYFLVAPVYQNTNADAEGNDVRHNIYLPEGDWIDYFTGEKYKGGMVINSFDAPLWKLPVFVKAGAIIPMNNAANNPAEIDHKRRIYEYYPEGTSSFTEYNDDGISLDYTQGKYSTTRIECQVNRDIAQINIHPAQGEFHENQKNKSTEFRINASVVPKDISLKIGGRNVPLKQAKTQAEYNAGQNVWFYTRPEFNRFSTPGSEFSKVSIRRNSQIWVKTEPCDIYQNQLEIKIRKFEYNPKSILKLHTDILANAEASVQENDRKAFSLRPSWKPVKGADYYEIEFGGMLYSRIRDTFFLFENLQPETEYHFRIRPVNKSASTWTSFSARTLANPLQEAIRGISARVSVRNQPGEGIANFFDFDESNLWHTNWDKAAVPFSMIINLNSINQVEKIRYLPRKGAGNGSWLKGKIYFSTDKITWKQAGSFDWKRNDEPKEFSFAEKPTARYLKIEVDAAVGDFGSGLELYVFRVPGSESYLPGDINNDRLIDENDLTSYMNYTGLRKGDPDFEGYISKGDLNNNNRIDAFDISNVATALEGGAWEESQDTLVGRLEIKADKFSYNKGDTVNITVSGIDLRLVNALGFSLPYNAADYEYKGVEATGTEQMTDLTRDRLHADGTKVLYPVFVNIGDKATLNGSKKLFTIRFIALKNLNFGLKAIDGILVDKRMEQLSW